MGKGNDAPKAPSYKAQTKASKKLVKAAQKGYKSSQARADEQFDYFKDQGEKDRAISDRSVDDLYKTAGLSGDFAASLQERYQNVFQPVEDELIQEYRDYASPERYDLNRGRAMADVAQQYEAARKNAIRELESYGVNPAATRFAALDLGVRTHEAAAKAAAANQADQQTDATKRALRSEALALGLKLPGMADEAADTSIAAHNAAVGNQLNATKVAADTQGTAPQYGALGAQYISAGTGAVNAGTNAQTAQHNAAMESYKAEQEASSGWGDVLGLAAGIGAKAFLGPTMPWVFANRGGAIPAPGAVPDAASPSGGQSPDDVNAKLTAGEFVVPEDVTRWFGEKHFQTLIQKARKEKQGAQAKPSVGPAIPGPITYTSRPGVGAIPQR